MATITVSSEEIARRLGLPASANQQLIKGEIVCKESEASTEKDLSLILAVLLNNTLDDIWEFAEAERMWEVQDATLSVGPIDPANPSAGLEAMDLAEDMVTKLMKHPFLSAAETNCVKEGLKKGKGAEIYKQVLAERAQVYWEKGLQGIMPYDGKGRDPAVDLTAATKVSLGLIQDPILRDEIQVVPAKSTRPDFHSLQWAIQQGNSLAAPILNHRIRIKLPQGVMNVTNQFYCGVDKDSSQMMSAVVPTPDPKKSIMFYYNHTYTSAVAGFGGGAKRTIGRKIMKGKLQDTVKKLQALKM